VFFVSMLLSKIFCLPLARPSSEGRGSDLNEYDLIRIISWLEEFVQAGVSTMSRAVFEHFRGLDGTAIGARSPEMWPKFRPFVTRFEREAAVHR
jgi:hypothetical protein